MFGYCLRGTGNFAICCKTAFETLFVLAEKCSCSQQRTSRQLADTRPRRGWIARGRNLPYRPQFSLLGTPYCPQLARRLAAHFA